MNYMESKVQTPKSSKTLNLLMILGNQLFDPKNFKSLGLSQNETWIFMREDRELASYYRFHKHKIIFFFAAMRAYRDELCELGYHVHYEELGSSNLNYEQALLKWIKKHRFQKIKTFEIEDKFFESRILTMFQENKVDYSVLSTPMFLTSRSDFQNYLKLHRKPFMKTFYESQRKHLNILVEDGRPQGGQWSFDIENRLALPKNHQTPMLPTFKVTSAVQKVISLVDEEFALHPGRGKDFWLPVDRAGAKIWLRHFFKDRLAQFGPYEDAIPSHSDFLYHSVLTPFLNCGLLTPREVIDQSLKVGQTSKIPLSSLEAFIRQIIGWREFIRGIYQNFSEQQETRNFWNHKNKLSPLWTKGETGIPPLDQTLKRVLNRGYAHHIERLMVVGNMMVLLEVDPQESYKWFMEMFIDSSDWVMGPNVYGMALFSDGGIFATKPYICGSYYLRKMGGFSKGPWCDAVDGLYWGFIKKHQDFFLKNPRLSMIARGVEKIPSERWQLLEKASMDLRKKLVVSL